MNRLTGDFKGVSMFATVEQALQYNRLRRYEDTGLTPDEIAALKADRDQWQDGTIIVKLADAEAEIERLCAALKLAQARAGDLEDEIAALRAENERLNEELTLERAYTDFWKDAAKKAMKLTEDVVAVSKAWRRRAEAAEMRIKRLDRLIDTKEDKHAI